MAKWTKTAEAAYQRELSYVRERWSVAIAKRFQSELRLAIDQVEAQPFIGPAIPLSPPARRWRVNQAVSLVYMVDEEGLIIILNLVVHRLNATGWGD